MTGGRSADQIPAGLKDKENAACTGTLDAGPETSGAAVLGGRCVLTVDSTPPTGLLFPAGDLPLQWIQPVPCRPLQGGMVPNARMGCVWFVRGTAYTLTPTLTAEVPVKFKADPSHYGGRCKFYRVDRGVLYLVKWKVRLDFSRAEEGSIPEKALRFLNHTEMLS